MSYQIQFQEKEQLLFDEMDVWDFISGFPTLYSWIPEIKLERIIRPDIRQAGLAHYQLFHCSIGKFVLPIFFLPSAP